MKANLGCPRYCEGYICVDLYPKDNRVIKADAIKWLIAHENADIEEITSFNLIEHLLNVGLFFEEVHKALKSNGLLTVRTDNAEWIPFYIPIINILGWGAHSSRKYRPTLDKTDWHLNTGMGHYGIFTKLHMDNFSKLYGFKMVSCKRVMLGSRLVVVMQKIDSVENALPHFAHQNFDRGHEA